MAAPRHRLTISVVIPVREDQRVLARCLAALRAQSRAADEVIVVDNGSTDDSADIAAQAGARVVSCAEPGIPAASSRGYDEAAHDIIVRLDADSMPSPSWLEDIVATFDRHPDASAVTGSARFVDGPPALRSPLASLYLAAYTAAGVLALGHRPLFGSNMAMRRDAWQDVRASVHRHDARLHDDLDLSFHLGERHRIGYLNSPMGISMRPFWSARSFAERIHRGFRTVVVHWPRSFPPFRWRRMSGTRRDRTAPESGVPLIGPTEAPGLHVMSWNIQRADVPFTPRSRRWTRRRPRVRRLLAAEQPTVLCVQEALPSQARFVRDSLGTAYRFVGRGRRAGGRGEGCPVFYDSERLELLEWFQVALSNTPSRQGSTSWGNLLPRIAVSVTFRDRVTSRRFRVINTHLDHLSSSSRLRSAQAIRELVASSAMPTVVTGDLNDTSGSAPLRALLEGGHLIDTWAGAVTRANEQWGTFSNHRAPRRQGRRIDWILATEPTSILRAAINANRAPDGWGSDHLPVQAVIVPSEFEGV